MAWREKVAACMLIFLLCCAFMFFIAALNRIVCPNQDVYTTYELTTMNNIDDVYVSAYGRVYKINDIVSGHQKSFQVERFTFSPYLGNDVSDMFHKETHWDDYCPGVTAPPDGWDNLAKRRPSHIPLL